MKVALFGYGKMGKEIEQLLLSRSHTVEAIIDNENDWKEQIENVAKCNVAIEFSTPQTVVSNILKCFDLNIPIVVGTTGWHNQLEEIKQLCQTNNKSLFTASNFSVGVNIFFEVNKLLAKLMKGHNEYEVEMTEIHHTQKLDAPSGTAVTLANDIIQNLDQKNSWASQEKKAGEELLITSVREGNVTGTHIITYESDIDTIEIKHEAKSRRGFVLGAVLAAEFLNGKTGFYGMNDLLKLDN